MVIGCRRSSRSARFYQSAFCTNLADINAVLLTRAWGFLRYERCPLGLHLPSVKEMIQPFTCPPFLSESEKVHSVLPEDAFKEFCASQLLGSYDCRECRDDIASCPQSYGYVQCLRQDGGWEEAHLLNLIDEDAIVQCLPCHYSTISCKFYARGWCMRGANCAYMHTLPT